MLHRYLKLLDVRTSDTFSVQITEKKIERNILLFDYIDIHVYERVK